MRDMQSIVDRGFYWTRRESAPEFPRDTLIIGIGSHGGRGLFLHGIVADGDWVALSPGDQPYRHKLPVVWDQTIYEGDFDALLDGVRYPRRGWSDPGRGGYASLLRGLFASARTR